MVGKSFAPTCALVLVAMSSMHCSAAQLRKPSSSARNPWGEVKVPTQGTAGPVGFYSAGCLDGAQALPSDGRGYQVMHLRRNRYYGHQELIDFIQRFTDQEVEQKVGVLLLGDMSQPRGGPMPTGHASHQVGLDVDVWYLLYPDAQYRPLTPEERETISSVSLVDMDKGEVLHDLWKPEHVTMLKVAAEQPEVQRIFVNAAIKRELCETLPVGKRDWIHKLRPWYGHDDHFHVRLKCPAGSLHCRKQDEVPPGDGCDELAWWLSPEGRALDKAGGPSTAAGEPRKMPELPELCGSILKAKTDILE